MSTKCAQGGVDLDLIRIGDKLISIPRIEAIVKDMLALRQQGVSQQEVAKKYNTDRTFCPGWKVLVK